MFVRIETNSFMVINTMFNKKRRIQMNDCGDSSPKPKFLALHYPIEGDSHFGTAYLFRADSIMKPILVISVISIWLNCIKYLFQAIFNIIFVYWNSNQTVLNELPTNWFSPLSWLISWPLSQVGTMSFLFWYSITNYVANVTVSSIL